MVTALKRTRDLEETGRENVLPTNWMAFKQDAEKNRVYTKLVSLMSGRNAPDLESFSFWIHIGD